LKLGGESNIEVKSTEEGDEKKDAVMRKKTRTDKKKDV